MWDFPAFHMISKFEWGIPTESMYGSWTDTTISWNLMRNLKKDLNSTSQTFCFPFFVLEPTKRGEGSRNFLEFRDPHKNVRQLTNEHHLTFMCYPSLFLFLSPNLKTKLKLHWGVGIFYPFTQLWEVYNLHIDRVWILDSR